MPTPVGDSSSHEAAHEPSQSVVSHKLTVQEAPRHSGGTTDASTKSGGNADAEQDEVRSLNAYSIYPTTVPPYALDYQFKRMKLRKNGELHPEVSPEQNFAFKDPFLVAYDGKWGKFASNVGSNVAYSRQRKRSVGESSEDISLGPRTSRKSTSTELEREKAKQEILTDLNTEWGGEKRLRELFDTPIMESFEFKNNEDRKQWVEYITRLKQYYYGGIPMGDLEARPGVSGELTGDGKSAQQGDWIEQLHDDMERFRQLKQRKIQQWRPQLARLLLDNPYVPLALRVFIGMFSTIALGLAIRVYQNSHVRIEKLNGNVGQQPSTIMAICVNTIAIVYIIYIAQDEFTGKPLGLRNPLGKLRLILLDLLFIIFSSANLALAFNTLFDKQWVCRRGGGTTAQSREHVSYICRKQRALSSFLFVMVVLWVMTFTISLVRVVEKVSSASPR